MNKIKFLILIIGFMYTQNVFSASDEQVCRSQIITLGKHLKVILAKINIMPPLVKIYSPLKQAFSDSIRAQRIKDYKTCISKTSIALKYSKAYAK